jgi:lipoprotein signal peptidase
MARSGIVLVLTATLIAGVDLAHKATAIADRGAAVLAHDRSAFYVIGIAAAATAWAGAIALTRSVSIALGGGVLAGGAVGNLVSLALWPSLAGVPNPLLANDVAFNVADVAVAAGLVLVLAATCVHAARNRERLREPVRFRA